jgi:proteasome assembly chaperone (PAC2) family protein
MKDRFRLSGIPELRTPSLIVGWSTDAGKLGSKVIDYLNKHLGGREIYEIEPTEFFPLGGVTIENDLIRFPESKLYACPENDLLLFKSDAPGNDWFKFINMVLDGAEHYGPMKELYVVGGMVVLGAHTAPREILPIFNAPGMKQDFSSYNLGRNMDYQTPPGQRPTFNSFLLWTAWQRNIPAVSLWVPIPFYLVAVEDFKAQKKILEFFDQRLTLKIDFKDIDEAISQQNARISQIRDLSQEIDEYISKLESNQRLSEKENEKLIKQIEEFLRRKASGL